MSRALVTVFCAGVAAWQYFTLTLPACSDCLTLTAQIAAGTADAPFVYRPLTPTILVTLGNTIPAHVAFHFVLFLWFFQLLWRWAERWGGNGLAAVALSTAALTVMLPTYYFSSYTVTEWVLWLAGLTLLTARSWPSAQPTGR